MHWLTTLPPRSIKTFGDLTTSFASQFAVNTTKRLEVADLFDIKQNKTETLKSYLPALTTSRLRACQFSDSLALRKPQSMEGIKARAEKHIEVEED
ncbi:hypothetical protein CR513_01170, partial [Mucuna pruriens]